MLSFRLALLFNFSNENSKFKFSFSNPLFNWRVAQPIQRSSVKFALRLRDKATRRMGGFKTKRQGDYQSWENFIFSCWFTLIFCEHLQGLFSAISVRTFLFFSLIHPLLTTKNYKIPNSKLQTNSNEQLTTNN